MAEDYENIDFTLDQTPDVPKEKETFKKPTASIKDLAADRHNSLSQEDLLNLQSRLMGRSEEFYKLDAKEKQEFVLNELQNYMLDRLTPVEELQKMMDSHTTHLELEGTEKGMRAPHLNIKAKKTALTITSEGGRVISFNNAEALAEYRRAIQEKNKNKENPTEVKVGENVGKAQAQGAVERKNRKFE